MSTGYFSTKATSAASSNQMSIYINTDGGVSFNGISNVDVADVTADNGTVHVVREVIGLPNVVTFAVADPNFSILEDALIRKPDFTYVATLSTVNGTSPAPFTALAPINTAFIDLLEELNLDALTDVPTATLTSTLNTHVVPGLNVLAAGLSDGMPIPTLGGELTANITGGATLTDPQNSVSKITAQIYKQIMA